MENITLGQVLGVILFIGSFIGGIEVIVKKVNEHLTKMLNPINKKIDSLELSSIKTDLVNFMCMAEADTITYEQKMNAYELFDRYTKLGGNSYVHDKWERLKKEGKI